MSDYLVWTDEDDDERQIDVKPLWWIKPPPREMTWDEADQLDLIPDVD